MRSRLSCCTINALFFLDDGALRICELPALSQTDIAAICRYCGAEMKIIAFVTETPSERAILAHIGEPTRPPVISPARGPPAWEEGPIEVDPDDDLLIQPEPEIEFDQRVQW